MITLIVVETLVFALLLTADLVSKQFVMPYLEANGDLVVIDKVLTFTPAYNTGAGFSMLSGKTGWLIAITVIGLVLIAAMLVYAHIKLNTKKKSTRFLLIVLVMMLAGGVGNLVDRIQFGWVRDFIDYTVVETLFHRSFAICNVADIWLTVGMVLLLVYVIFFWKDNAKEEDAVPDAMQVDVALRMLSVNTNRTVDPAQVTFVNEQCGEARSDEEAALADVTQERESQQVEQSDGMQGDCLSVSDGEADSPKDTEDN